MSSRILLADVNPNVQQMVAHALAAEQIETVCASDGWTALCLLNETNPDLLIAEISLPDKSGYDLCRYIREEPEFQSLPVVLLDDHFDVFNQGVARSLGADIYLSKPFEPGSVVGVVRKLLESRGENYGDGPALAPLAETRQQSPLPESRSHEEPARRPDAKPVVTAGQSFNEPTIITSSTQAVLPRAQPHDRGPLAKWAVLAAAILAVIGLAILERALTARRTPPDERPLMSSPITPQQSSSDEQALSRAGGLSDRGTGNAPQKEGPGNTSAEPEYARGRGDTMSSGDQGEAREEAKAGPTQRQTESSTGTTVTPRVESSRNAESSRSASAQRVPSAAPANDSQTVLADQRYPSAGRPRSVSPVRSATLGGHLKRGGREMREAGEHFGSGVKHFWKSGEKVAVKTGKKVGGGVKRMGQALKKIF